MSQVVVTLIAYEFDLVAVAAKYDNNCYNTLLRHTAGHKVGRPEGDLVNLMMEEIFGYIENIDCQFILQELKDISKNQIIDNKTIKRR